MINVARIALAPDEQRIAVGLVFTEPVPEQLQAMRAAVQAMRITHLVHVITEV